MRLVQQLFGSTIPMFVNVAILFYVCQRVRRARDNLRYIGERVTKGMDEIKDDVGKELRITSRLTTQSANLASVLRRFADLEENVIELVRMDRNRESVRVETPVDVSMEIERIIAAVERERSVENRQHPREVERSEELMTTQEQVRDSGPRNPLTKFSACAPREIIAASGGSAATPAMRKTIDGRNRIGTTPEVRLLGESNRPLGTVPAESKR
ncbi:PREDICTED: uncharacterized protein LOC108550929 [Eufriesea mexicana]|uniref:uncharacterized protein LOC108550929 n=1 Tax=Eufriesea mexicana TaxID=516756 RepID=UPI00083C5A7C|nr:PREDICTED: uncharacterized protein LOC108550929 [Eufriesea mexicana]